LPGPNFYNNQINKVIRNQIISILLKNVPK